MKPKPLTQISLSIAPEAEDAVSVMFESVFGYSPSIYVDAESGAVTATIYVEPKKWSDRVRRQLKDGFTNLRRSGLSVVSDKISVKKLRREDWAESWKRHFKPIDIGNALLIKPSWNRRKPKRGQHLIVLDPGLSFGTGQHATTSFCLRQLVACRKPDLSQSFLDIGTGSGILAIAAAKLGYTPVEAFDFDADAVRIAKENAKANQTRPRLFRGDLTKLPSKAARRFDVVCANLTYDLLLKETTRILNRLKPEASLVLAGILQSQFPLVQKAYEKRGMKLLATQVEREWQSGLFVSAV